MRRDVEFKVEDGTVLRGALHNPRDPKLPGVVVDGLRGAGGCSLHLKEIIDFVADGWGSVAVDRWEAKKRDEAAALVALGAPQEQAA